MNRLIDRLRTRLSSEDGWVVVTAIVLIAIMLGVGLAVLATADTQSQQSRTERVRESAFEYAEGLLQAESVVLQNNWPSQAPCTPTSPTCGYAWSAADPNVCTQATAAANPTQCPSTTALSGIFANVDQRRTTVTWDVQVRDDLGVCLTNPPSGYIPFYSTCQVPTYFKGICPLRTTPTNPALCWPTVTSNQSADPNNVPGDDKPICTNSVACTWDANGNKQLFVRVDATIQVGSGTGARKTTRSLVALLHLENFPVNLNSKDAVNGGAINFSNSGNKDIIDATNSRIVARCYPSTPSNGPPSSGAQPRLSTTLSLPAPAGTRTLTVPNGDAVPFSVGQTVAIGVGLLNASTYEVRQISAITHVPNPLVPDVITLDPTNDALASGHVAGERVELAPPPPGGSQSSSNNCESWIGQSLPHANSDKHQVDPVWAYISDPSYPRFMTPGTFKTVTATLKHWTTCPVTHQDWSGGVYIQSVPTGTTCTMPGGPAFNSHPAPGFVFVDTQPNDTCSSTPALQLSSNTVYYGVIYMANNQNCGYGQEIVKVTAGAQIDGGVAVDGFAKVTIGQTNGGSQNCPVLGGSIPNQYCPSIKFDPVEFGGITATGAAGLVQNTWRELAPGQ